MMPTSGVVANLELGEPRKSYSFPLPSLPLPYHLLVSHIVLPLSPSPLALPSRPPSLPSFP